MTKLWHILWPPNRTEPIDRSRPVTGSRRERVEHARRRGDREHSMSATILAWCVAVPFVAILAYGVATNWLLSLIAVVTLFGFWLLRFVLRKRANR